jgi:hypothetical protein
MAKIYSLGEIRKASSSFDQEAFHDQDGQFLAGFSVNFWPDSSVLVDNILLPSCACFIKLVRPQFFREAPFLARFFLMSLSQCLMNGHAECTNELTEERNIYKLTNFCLSILFAREIFTARTDFLHPLC